ncbi:uncharacterized protein LOC113783719 isoform X3 [Coffea eugenioides]|uniref:uncharacterized protein LOC113783719 isoform X3 n=1 Tax=Coffea eugenioides TaxID=49369 RepID=UPI000F606F33|nr:uncharacterized protein LOC113783719 isoform X3 [Coffea eugenioides]
MAVECDLELNWRKVQIASNTDAWPGRECQISSDELPWRAGYRRTSFLLPPVGTRLDLCKTSRREERSKVNIRTMLLQKVWHKVKHWLLLQLSNFFFKLGASLALLYIGTQIYWKHNVELKPLERKKGFQRWMNLAFCLKEQNSDIIIIHS